MKKTILAAAALCLSVSAFAQIRVSVGVGYNAGMCSVDMIDTYTNRLITTIRANDYGDDCKEGMKVCRKEIRDRGLYGRADCVRTVVSNPYPNPYPNPNPNPNPNPYPNPYPGPTSMDARRMINQGESVIFNNRFVTVMGVSFNGLYAVRSTDGWNTITNNLRREELSVTNGCSMNLCTSDSVIDVMSARYVKIVGLSFNETFTTQSTDGWNTLTSNIERRNLAETKGCVTSRYSQLCVGNTVINTMNRYSTVVGIQLDGRVVLRSTDGWNTITTNVDPSNLVVTR